tara:strand:+ start:11234 stop:11437 length:204 start_codon:yes stop_codon:yes gene_type:complete
MVVMVVGTTTAMRSPWRVSTAMVPWIANHWLAFGSAWAGQATGRPEGVASAKQQRTVSLAINGGPSG